MSSKNLEGQGLSKSILQELSLVEVYVGPRSDEWSSMTLSQRVEFGIQDEALETERFKAFANEYPDVLLTILRLSGVGEIGRRTDPLDAAYWQGVQDLSKTILRLSALEGKNAQTTGTETD